jgi:maltose O-acetyltransferase
VSLGQGVHLYTVFHPLDPEARKGLLATNPPNPNYYELASPIRMGSNCWVGDRVIFCPGSEIGNNVRVEAGAVLTKKFPSNVVLGGNPATILMGQSENYKE